MSEYAKIEKVYKLDSDKVEYQMQPETSIKAVFNDDNNRLDSIIDGIGTRIDGVSESLGKIGTISSGTLVTATTTSGAYTKVATLTIEKGKWIIRGGCQFPAGYAGKVACVGLAVGGTHVGTGTPLTLPSGFAPYLNDTMILNASGATTINLCTHQSFGANVDIQKWYLTAIKIND